MAERVQANEDLFEQLFGEAMAEGDGAEATHQEEEEEEEEEPPRPPPPSSKAPLPEPAAPAVDATPPPGITGSMDQDVLRARRETDRVLQLLQDALDTGSLSRAPADDARLIRDALRATQVRLVQLQRQHEHYLKLILVHVYEQQRLHPVAEENGAGLMAAVYRR